MAWSRVDQVYCSAHSSTLGSTTIIYSYEGTLDTYYCQRVVQVIDTVPPVVTLLPGVDTIFVDDEHIDAGIVSSDEYSEELTTVIVTNVDVTEAGTYSIIYTVTDEEGNRTVATRVVTVIDLD